MTVFKNFYLQVLQWLRSQFTEERLHARITRFKQGLRISWKIFNEKGVLSHASVCSYSTILSLVPILAFSLVILNMFTSTTYVAVPVPPLTNEEDIQQTATQTEAVSNRVFDFFFNHFVPGIDVDDTEEIAQTKAEIINIIRKAANLRFLILFFLIVTCVSLYNSIEYAYNEIWTVRNRRTYFSRFIAFWILLTITPILIGFSIYLTSEIVRSGSFSRFEAITRLMESQGNDSKIFWHTVSYLMTFTAFMIANRFLPNTRVYFIPAFIASAISALMFESAKSLFDYYISYSLQTTDNYYSIFRLATIPIFILWLYYCYVCFLIGPVIATTIQDFDHHLAHLRRYSWKYSPKPIQSVYIFIHICRHFRLHRNGISIDRLEEETGIVFEQLRRSLKSLEQAQLIHMDRLGQYYPNADPDSITIGEVLHGVIGLKTESEDSFNPQISMINDTIHTLLNGKNNIPVSAFISEGRVNDTYPVARQIHTL